MLRKASDVVASRKFRKAVPLFHLFLLLTELFVLRIRTEGVRGSNQGIEGIPEAR